MHVLIVLPLQAEIDLLSEALRTHGLGLERAQVGRLPVTIVPEMGATLARGGHGKAQFALHTRHLLDHIGRADLVVCAGAAGALAPGIGVGDIVAATRTVEHDYQVKFSARAAPAFPGDQSTLQKLQAFTMAGRGFTLHFGDVASGDEDVVTADRARALRVGTGAVAVAWEGAGGARACAFSHTPYLELRGVTDQATAAAPEDFARNLMIAMRNIATLIVAWLGPR